MAEPQHLVPAAPGAASPAAVGNRRDDISLPGRQVRHGLPAHDWLAEAADTVGTAVGRAAGYVQSRRPSDVRADAERLIAERPVEVLGAALCLGFLVGFGLRR
jgi:hypothetical protein